MEEEPIEEGRPINSRSETVVAEPVAKEMVVVREREQRKEEEEEESKKGDLEQNPYLAVENLNNSYGIDMDTVCDFWNSYKKEFIHLKDWHHKQK